MSFYRDRAVLVVGGFGFIGLNLTVELARLGARVTVVTPSLDRHRSAAADGARRGVRAIEGDLRDADAMRLAVANQDVVFNLAGRSGAVRRMAIRRWATCSTTAGTPSAGWPSGAGRTEIGRAHV